MSRRLRDIGSTQRKFLGSAFDIGASMFFGALGATYESTGPRSFAGGVGFYAGDALRRAGTTLAAAGFYGTGMIGAGLREGMGLQTGLLGEYRSWRREGAIREAIKRQQVDVMGVNRPYNQLSGALEGVNPYSLHAEYAKQKNGYRRFGHRSPGEHLRKGASNMMDGLFHPLGVGINLGLSVAMSGDDIFDPRTGMARALAENVGGEIGFVGGGAIGAALGKAALPSLGFLGPLGGIVAGVVIGGQLAMSAADLPWKISEFGNTYGRRSAYKRSQFIDSQQAATMRQRAVQSINRSHMSARSAFGQEALAYHA